jgi:inosose dehydratase
MRIGTAPITWGVCELENWGEVLPYPRVLDEMAELGYVGTELGPWGYLPRDPSSLRRELDARGLALAGAFCPVTLHDPARYAAEIRRARETAALLRDLGAATIVLAEAGDERRRKIAGRVPADGSMGFGDEEWRRFAEGTNEVARMAREIGLATAFHPHAGTYVETPAEIERLLRSTDPAVGLCLDTGHVTYGGGDASDLARRHTGRIRHIHAKDVRRAVIERVRMGALDYVSAVGAGVFSPLGDGVVNFSSLLRDLRNADYNGWLIVEQDIRITSAASATEPKENARRSFQYLQSALAT